MKADIVQLRPAQQPKGPWSLLSSGKAFDLLGQDERQVDIRDIANHLAKQCRFAGGTRRDVFYTVAQHSVHVSRVLKKHGPLVQMLGLMHDAHEAYIGDQITPVKEAFLGFDLYNARADIEDTLQRQIHRAFRLPEKPSAKFQALVHEADAAVFATEVRDLTADAERPLCISAEPLSFAIKPWPWMKAEEQFLAQFDELSIAAGIKIGA